MTVQIIEIAGQRIAMLPVADYERLLELAEDRVDLRAAEAAEQRRQDGEEYLPSEMVDRLLAGESPLRVWRAYRGMTLEMLSRKSGVTKGHLSDIERGRRKGTAALRRKVADALGVSSDDLLSEI